MNWFGGEFYRLADELAAEVARLRERWGDEIVHRRWRTFHFSGISIPPGATIVSVDFVTHPALYPWDEVNVQYTGDGGATVTARGEMRPVTTANTTWASSPFSLGCQPSGISDDYGEWYETELE